MLNNFVLKQITKTILSSLKGKKKWTLILVLIIATFLQSQGFDLTDFINSLNEMLQGPIYANV